MDFNRRVAGCWLAVLSLGAGLFLAGCGNAVQGRMLHAPETFTGESTASLDGDGSITLISNRGARCHGPYSQVPDDKGAEVGADHSEENGVAMLSCTDGRTGKVMFQVGPDQAVGTGMLGKDIVTLTIAE